jgi:hypothetical protein
MNEKEVTIVKLVGRISVILTITATTTTRKSTTSLHTTLIYFEGYCPVECDVMWSVDINPHIPDGGSF